MPDFASGARRKESGGRGLRSPQSQATRNGAVDAIKGIAIVSVLLLHSLPKQLLRDSLSVFHVSQAVPILIVLMGYIGVVTRMRPLGDYLRRRAVRLLVPWGVAWLAALLIMLLKGRMVWKSALLLGALPANGPGNYFIAIALQFILVLPLLRWLLDKGPWLLIGACLAVDFSFQLLVGQFGLNAYVFKANLLRYLFAIGLGMLLATGHRVWPLVAISLPYLVAKTRGFTMPFLAPGWQSQNLLASGYTIALVSAGLRLKYPRPLQAIGRGSWHIFLVQILWFGQVAPAVTRHLGLGTGPKTVLDLAVCIVLGIAFAGVEQRVTDAVRTMRGGSTRGEIGPAPSDQAGPQVD